MVIAVKILQVIFKGTAFPSEWIVSFLYTIVHISNIATTVL